MRQTERVLRPAGTSRQVERVVSNALLIYAPQARTYLNIVFGEA